MLRLAGIMSNQRLLVAPGMWFGIAVAGAIAIGASAMKGRTLSMSWRLWIGANASG
jgi:hypothetical protein